jgi:hypothetical protein
VKNQPINSSRDGKQKSRRLSGIKPLKENIERLRTSFQQAFSRAQQTLRNEDFVEAQRTEQELKEAEKTTAGCRSKVGGTEHQQRQSSAA